MKNIAIVVGARPNFIKVAPLIYAIKKAKKEGNKIDFTLIYSGSEVDESLENSLFDDLQIERPTVYLGVDCENLNELTGKVMSAFEHYLQTNKVDIVIVVDDLASTLAVSIVAKKQNICLAHLVAGTRSFDINMPKEVNRLVIDGLSDLLFTAGIKSNSTATREGGYNSQVYMVGNILLDTLRYNHSRFIVPSILKQKGIKDGQYLVFTLNRKVLLANVAKLNALLKAVVDHAKSLPIIAPLRGRAKELVEAYVNKNGLNNNFIVTEPMSYLNFGYLTANAKVVITDSGNVSEEATFNGVPCITLNNYTEHIETVDLGTNVLVGEDAVILGNTLKNIMSGKIKKHSIPERWDGRSADRIVSILLKLQ